MCLLTPRSLDRPWLLYEAGVAKGKLGTAVYGIALGVARSRASTGPFAQFQNCDDDEESLTKVVMQLVERIPGSAHDHDAILMQVRTFKERAKEVLAKSGAVNGSQEDVPPDNSAIAKMFEEVKVMFRDLPGRFEPTATERDRPVRRRRLPPFHPMMIQDVMAALGNRLPDAAVGVLMTATPFRDELPWIYELGVEAYRALKSGDGKRSRDALRVFQRAIEFIVQGPLVEEFGLRDRESDIMLASLPHFIDHITKRLRRPARPDEKPA